MIPVERRQIILEMVAEKGIVSIAELTDRMNVSHMTIRRDLQKLEQQGAVVLVSGGAGAVTGAYCVRWLPVARNRADGAALHLHHLRHENPQ